MRRIALLFACACVFGACNNNPKEEVSHHQDSTTNTAVTESTATSQPQTTERFDIQNIPLTTADIGAFPFITLPKGLKERSKPIIKKFDQCFFPIEGIMTPFEGKLYKVDVVSEKGEEFSKHYFERSIENYLISVGAVKVFDGEITREEYYRYTKIGSNNSNQGVIGYFNEHIKFYVIRSKDKGNIYVQISANDLSAKLNILQEESFQQTITKVTSADIAKDLNEKGKSILYINFDTDQSTLTIEGREVVKQIANALKNESALKISIEGHTDNSGDAKHNKLLSKQRANAVLTALVADNVDQARLATVGFGSDKPLVTNESEENRAKNRRVELVKIN